MEELKVSLKKKVRFLWSQCLLLSCAELVDRPDTDLPCSHPCPRRAPCTNLPGLFSCCTSTTSTFAWPKMNGRMRIQPIELIKQPAERQVEIVTCICHKRFHQSHRGTRVCVINTETLHRPELWKAFAFWELTPNYQRCCLHLDFDRRKATNPLWDLGRGCFWLFSWFYRRSLGLGFRRIHLSVFHTSETSALASTLWCLGIWYPMKVLMESIMLKRKAECLTEKYDMYCMKEERGACTQNSL